MGSTTSAATPRVGLSHTILLRIKRIRITNYLTEPTVAKHIRVVITSNSRLYETAFSPIITNYILTGWRTISPASTFHSTMILP